MKKLILSISFLLVSVLLSGAVYADDGNELHFTPDSGGKYIYCNNHEFIRRSDLADNSNESAHFIMNNENLTPDNYALFASHVNHTEKRSADGTRIIEPGFDIELDVLFRAEEDTVITLSSLGFEVPAHKQYWYQGNSYTYEEAWGCFNAWASYLKLPIHQIDSGTLYNPIDFQPQEITLKAGEEMWLSEYIPNYREVPFFRPVNLLADFTIQSGMCDVNIAALKSTGTPGDRTNFFKNAAHGFYDRDRQYKGIADSLNKVSTELSYTIDDWTWSDTQLPVKVFNNTHPDGFETQQWYTHLNPRADEWSYAICAQSDMLSFKYYDPVKKYFYGSYTKDSADDFWYFDTEHNDASSYPGLSFGSREKYIPNALMTDSTSREYACNLGNYGVILSYKINVTNNGSMIRYFNYRLNTGSNNVVILRDANGRPITPYAVCKGANASRVLDNMACVELPAQQTTSFIVQVILTTNYAGGMENSMTITDTPQMVEVYASGRQEITKDYGYTGREFYQWSNGRLYLSQDHDTWVEQPLSDDVKEIFNGNWNEYEIKYTGSGYMVKAGLYDGIPYYGVRDFFKSIYFLDESFELEKKVDFQNYPTAITAANGLFYVKAGTPYYSADKEKWDMGNSKMPCWNYGKFSARVNSGEIYLSTDGKDFARVNYTGFKPSYIDALGDIYYYADRNTLYVSSDGIYWSSIIAENAVSSIYKTNDEIVINKSEHFPIPYMPQRDVIMYNGEYLSCTAAPIYENGTLLLPLRAVCEALGAEVSWDSGVTSITLDGSCAELTADSSSVKLNGNSISMDSAAVIRDGAMMLPSSFAKSLLGCGIEYGNGIVKIDKIN